MRRVILTLPALLACTALAGESTATERQVRDADIAFAATMAARDIDAFAEFIAGEAVFVRSDGTLRGRQA